MNESAMRHTVSASMREFLVWVSDRPRSYREAMEAWRTSCPRLSVWEDAIIEGLVQLENGDASTVALTSLGRAALAQGGGGPNGSGDGR